MPNVIVVKRLSSRWRPASILCGIMLLLTACAGSGLTIDTDPSAIVAAPYTSLKVADPSARRLRERHVLVLTSGGADGAFGAGVLVAWSSSGSRPVFDIVTGASTGALQATAAFLGSEFDGLLERVYTETRTHDVFRPNGIKTLYGSGYYDPTPLRDLMLSQMTDAMLDRVAAEHAKGRRLYVVTTDMTSGSSVYWNMGAIASENGSNRKARFVNILIASVAVPGLVEPVRVAQGSAAYALHSDGGVRAPVPLAPFMLGGNKSNRQTVWVIANGHVSRDTALRSDAGSTLGLARRGVSQVLRQLLYVSVEDARTRTLRAGGRFRLVALPETIAEAADPFEFKPHEMRGLFEIGKQIGTDASF